MKKIDIASKNVVQNLMGIKKTETVLIIFDENMIELAESLYNASQKAAKKTALLKIHVGKVDGQEPDKTVAEEMKKFDVIIIPTTKSLTHTKARKEACKAGARVATMPGITKDTFERTLTIDYKKVDAVTQRLYDALNISKKVRVTTPAGTDVTFKVRPYRQKPEGYILKKGSYNNLPAGETMMAPLEGTMNGKIVFEKSFSNIGLIKDQIIAEVESGFAKKISGGKSAEKLKKILVSTKNPAVYNIAELGIGTNYAAKITGCFLEDEKVFQTAHFALGNNTAFNGLIYAPLHLDGLIIKPTIIIDDKKVIMKDGKLMI